MSDIVQQTQPLSGSQLKIAILGGGVAGTTIALRFAELGLDTTLIEKGPSLVNGPPMCHLHAGGNLYREISDDQCLTLLKQSIDIAKVYPHSINKRPTIIALPITDSGQPKDLLPRLDKLQKRYQALVAEDNSNRVLGEPNHYYQFYTRQEIEALVGLPLPNKAKQNADWLISFANHTDLNKIKFPILLVQEFGWSAFRVAAIANYAIGKLPNCHLKTDTQVTELARDNNQDCWRVVTQIKSDEETHSQEECFDYVVNACGFKSGDIDDMLDAQRTRMVEFKAAYVAKWPECEGLWPEIVFHGERGTPQGMAQLTPYPDGYFQLHGMTEDITLFEQGLVSSTEESAQPKLANKFIEKIDNQWPTSLIENRTLGSIEHIARFIPEFIQAEVAAKPLFGAQQIPGNDPDLRTADVSFHGKNYARAEIVKASSALAAADEILLKLVDSKLIDRESIGEALTEHYFPVSKQCSIDEVNQQAMALAGERRYPTALAKNL